jgi:hypothetical protein
MEKWKAKIASHFPTPPTTATSHIFYSPRYTNNLLVQKIGQARRMGENGRLDRVASMRIAEWCRMFCVL